MPFSVSIIADTNNILFIVGGAFVGLEKIVERRAGTTSSVGFGSASLSIEEKERESAKILKKLQPDDLLKFGLIPEFIGRIPIYTVLDPLDEKTLKMILTEPKNAIIKQYACLMDMDGVKLRFEDDAIDLISDITSDTSIYKNDDDILYTILASLILSFKVQSALNSEIKYDECYVAKIKPELEKLFNLQPDRFALFLLLILMPDEAPILEAPASIIAKKS